MKNMTNEYRYFRNSNFVGVKGYLHHRTITSQNESSEAQDKDFFIS